MIMDAATTERALGAWSNYPVHARVLQPGGLGGIEIFPHPLQRQAENQLFRELLPIA
jgi:hypothetical protein